MWPYERRESMGNYSHNTECDRFDCTNVKSVVTPDGYLCDEHARELLYLSGGNL